MMNNIKINLGMLRDGHFGSIVYSIRLFQLSCCFFKEWLKLHKPFSGPVLEPLIQHGKRLFGSPVVSMLESASVFLLGWSPWFELLRKIWCYSRNHRLLPVERKRHSTTSTLFLPGSGFLHRLSDSLLGSKAQRSED